MEEVIDQATGLIDKGCRPKASTKGDWSSGMIPALGAGGPGFNSRIAPFLLHLRASANE